METVGRAAANLESPPSRLRNKLVVGYKRQPWNFRYYRYEIFRFKHQWQVVVKVVELLIEQDKSLLPQLVGADRDDFANSSHREVRYVTHDKESLPRRNRHKAGDIYLGLTLNKGQKYRLLRRICEVAEIDFSQERRITV